MVPLSFIHAEQSQFNLHRVGIYEDCRNISDYYNYLVMNQADIAQGKKEGLVEGR